MIFGIPSVGHVPAATASANTVTNARELCTFYECLRKGGEHEPPVPDLGMRKDEARLVECCPLVPQEIEIEGPWSPFLLVFAVSAGGLLEHGAQAVQFVVIV